MSDTQFDDEDYSSATPSAPPTRRATRFQVAVPIALAPGVTVVYTTRLGGVSHGDFGDCRSRRQGRRRPAGDSRQSRVAREIHRLRALAGQSGASRTRGGRRCVIDLNTPFGSDVSGTPGEVTADGEAPGRDRGGGGRASHVSRRCGAEHVRCGLPAGADGRRRGRRDRRRWLRAQGPSAASSVPRLMRWWPRALRRSASSRPRSDRASAATATRSATPSPTGSTRNSRYVHLDAIRRPRHRHRQGRPHGARQGGCCP